MTRKTEVHKEQFGLVPPCPPHIEHGIGLGLNSVLHHKK